MQLFLLALMRWNMAKVKKEQNVDILDLTYGAWDRAESVQATVSEARRAFRDSMTRHHG